jgi:hypothetical protein
LASIAFDQAQIDLGLAARRARIEVALQRNLVAHATAGRADVDGPVEADGVAADAAMSSSHRPAALGEDDDGMLLAVFLAGQAGDDARM